MRAHPRGRGAAGTDPAPDFLQTCQQEGPPSLPLSRAISWPGSSLTPDGLGSFLERPGPLSAPLLPDGPDHQLLDWAGCARPEQRARREGSWTELSPLRQPSSQERNWTQGPWPRCLGKGQEGVWSRARATGQGSHEPPTVRDPGPRVLLLAWPQGCCDPSSSPSTGDISRVPSSRATRTACKITGVLSTPGPHVPHGALVAGQGHLRPRGTAVTSVSAKRHTVTQRGRGLRGRGLPEAAEEPPAPHPLLSAGLSQSPGLSVTHTSV